MNVQISICSHISNADVCQQTSKTDVIQVAYVVKNRWAGCVAWEQKNIPELWPHRVDSYWPNLFYNRIKIIGHKKRIESLELTKLLAVVKKNWFTVQNLQWWKGKNIQGTVYEINIKYV